MPATVMVTIDSTMIVRARGARETLENDGSSSSDSIAAKASLVRFGAGGDRLWAPMVRSATIDDAQAIARVHVASWHSTYAVLLPSDFLESLNETDYAERWRRLIREGASCVYVVEHADEVVGFASGGRERAGETGYEGELYAIYVLDDHQHRGYGRELLRAVIAGLREMGLEDMIIWVLRDNRNARGFYERLGGVYVRTQPITLGSATLEEVSYGWPSLSGVRF